MIYMFLSYNPSSGDINLSNLPCYSLFGKYHNLTCCERKFNIQASLYSTGDWFESYFLKTTKTGFLA